MDRARLEPWIDPAAYACAVAYGLVAWWPIRDLPFHWDGATYVVDAARDLLASGFRPLVASGSDFAHPTLFIATLALAWGVLGPSRVVAHALVLPALPAAMIATYLLGKRLSGRPVGAVAAVLLGGVAVVLEEVGQVYMDLPVAALLAWALVAWTAGRRWTTGVLLSVAALMKLPAPLTVPAALLAVALASPAGRRDLRSIAPPLVLPFAVDAVWVAYHLRVTGWALWQGHVVSAPRGLLDPVRALGLVVEWLLLGQWRWVLVAGAVAAMAWTRLVRKQRLELAPLWPLVAPVAVGVALFVAVDKFALRYGIYLLPPFFVATLTLARAALPARTGGAWLAAGGAALFGLFATTWHPAEPLSTSYEFRPDENLAYLDLVHVGEDLGSWVARRHPDDEIYGAGPESYVLAEPWQGYVDAPLPFTWCRDFVRHPDRTQLVIVHDYHPQQPRCRQIVESTGATPVKLIEHGGKWMQVYRVPPLVDSDPAPTPSASAP